MNETIALVAILAPAGLVAAALIARNDAVLRPKRALAAGRAATVGALAVALASALLVAIEGAGTSVLIGVDGFGLSFRLDAFSAVMFVLVAFVGAIVLQYSRNYLDGDPRQGAFISRLCITLAAVLLLVTSGNVVQLVGAWIATSLALHTLLVFYPERRKAQLAARKKFITARISDACLIGAALLLSAAFDTTDIATILAIAGNEGADALTSGVVVATLLIAVAALLKSAQFPFHGWLPQVMETPTPVSALLHAGIINAGGFLVIRFADVMVLSASALLVLALVGGLTALFGAVVMLTQNSIKVSVAWSTVSQMGFMLLECGLGLFPIAVLHIVAHSLYKAHAFLASGSVVEIARASWVPGKAAPSPVAVLASLGIALLVYLGIGWAFGLLDFGDIYMLTIGAIIVMGLTLLIAQAFGGEPDLYVIGRTVGASVAVTLAYFALRYGVETLFDGTLPPPPEPNAFAYVVVAMTIASFTAVTVLQLFEPARAASPFWRSMRLHLVNGLYADAVFDRLIGALRKPAAHLSKGGADGQG